MDLSTPIRPLIVAATVLGLAAACRAEETAADQRLPIVGLEESGGHLAFRTYLPAGRGNFTADDPTGMRLEGFVYVTGEKEERRPRIFRLRGQFPAEEDAENAAPREPRAPEFFINLQATPTPDHYVLHIKATVVLDGKTVEEEARLGRNCCGYFVSATQNGTPLPIGRGRLIPEIMVEAAATYRQFERLAEACCRPGFEFVPSSRFSPRVVQEVVASDEAVPGEPAVQRFSELVKELDSDQFSRREAAATELVRGGRSTLWSLDRLGEQQLSAEQRHRLSHVRDALKEFSEPHLPFHFGGDQIRKLTAEPPQDWLLMLRHSSEKQVSDWAIRKTSSAAAAVHGEAPAHVAGQGH